MLNNEGPPRKKTKNAEMTDVLEDRKKTEGAEMTDDVPGPGPGTERSRNHIVLDDVKEVDVEDRKNTEDVDDATEMNDNAMGTQPLFADVKEVDVEDRKNTEDVDDATEMNDNAMGTQPLFAQTSSQLEVGYLNRPRGVVETPRFTKKVKAIVFVDGLPADDDEEIAEKVILKF